MKRKMKYTVYESNPYYEEMKEQKPKGKGKYFIFLFLFCYILFVLLGVLCTHKYNEDGIEKPQIMDVSERANLKEFKQLKRHYAIVKDIDEKLADYEKELLNEEGTQVNLVELAGKYSKILTMIDKDLSLEKGLTIKEYVGIKDTLAATYNSMATYIQYTSQAINEDSMDVYETYSLPSYNDYSSLFLKATRDMGSIARSLRIYDNDVNPKRDNSKIIPYGMVDSEKVIEQIESSKEAAGKIIPQE